jgi:hypothetical protein
LQITYRMESAGPQADVLGRQIGPEISADFPQTLQHWPSAPRADSRRRANEV